MHHADDVRTLLWPPLQPIVHWGFIPTVIVLGFLFTKPKPTIGQLLFVG